LTQDSLGQQEDYEWRAAEHDESITAGLDAKT
jgi:hypothetical protein